MKRHLRHKLETRFSVSDDSGHDLRNITVATAGLSARLDARFGREPNVFRRHSNLNLRPSAKSADKKS